MRGIIGREDGFTLVEVLVALVIFMIGIMGVMGMQYMAVRGNSSSRELRVATSLANDLLEQALSMRYTDLTAAGGLGAATGANPADVAFITPPPADASATGGVNFTRRAWVQADCQDLTLEDDDLSCVARTSECAEALTNAAAVRARICWQDRDGLNHSVTLNTIRWAL